MYAELRIAILGGTFNPPHNGHVSIANSVLQETEAEEILLIPANIPAHKGTDVATHWRHRWNMLEEVASDHPGFIADDCEIVRGGISYTIDTVNDIVQRRKPTGRPGLVIGDDLVDGFHTWKCVDDLLTLVDLIVARREIPARNQFAYPHVLLSNPFLTISSREIRNQVRTHQDISRYVPESVERYISLNGLYVD